MIKTSTRRADNSQGKTHLFLSCHDSFCVNLQFSGGFDAESMRAFEELRSRVNKQTEVDEKSDA